MFFIRADYFLLRFSGGRTILYGGRFATAVPKKKQLSLFVSANYAPYSRFFS